MPGMARGLYEVLGVSQDAALAEIRVAYRTQAAKLHPDRGGDPTVFAELQEAYAVLSNVSRRQQYDNSLRPPKAPPRSSPDAKAVARQPSQPPPTMHAAAGGQSLASVPVPESLEKPVAHIVMTERDGARNIRLVSNFPMIDNSQVRVGEVLVAMRAVPLSHADVNAEHLCKPGEFYGLQGIGEVLLVGPQVTDLQSGDWVLPLRKLDEEGDLAEDVAPPGTGRALAVFPAEQCARLTLPPQFPMNANRLALAKPVAAAFRMVEEYTENLVEGDTVIVNCANGLIGRVLVQALSVLKFQVIAVIRDHPQAREEMDFTCRRLRDMGAIKVLFDDDDIRSKIENAKINLPQLAFDGVGGDATARLACTLSKTGDIVCYGTAGGSKKQVLPSAWGRKWKGSVTQFNFDEWIYQDMAANSRTMSEALVEASNLMKLGRLQLDIEEFSTQDFLRATQEMLRPSRTSSVVLHFPRLDLDADAMAVEVARSQVLAGPRRTGPTKGGTPLPPAPQDLATTDKPAKMSWDIDFLEWEEEEEDELEAEKRTVAEGNLFKPDPVMDELRLMPYVDDALASPVALEIGAAKGEATHVLFWLPGANEVPEEHGPWLTRLSASHPGLRVLILKPRTGFKWFEMTDAEAVKLGLRFAVLDDIDTNLEGDPMKSAGELAFPPLKMPEIEALQQIEGASIGLARRAVIEEKEMGEKAKKSGNSGKLPFFFGGFGQGGTIALYAAVCLMKLPICGVVFSHAGVPAAGMLGKRLSPTAARQTRLCAVYDKADKEVPPDFPEALHHMLSLLGCRISLEWLAEGDGHDFFDDAAARVTQCFNQCLEDKGGGPNELAAARAARFGGFYGKEELNSRGPQAMSSVDSHSLQQWRKSVQRRGGKVSDVVLTGAPVQVA